MENYMQQLNQRGHVVAKSLELARDTLHCDLYSPSKCSGDISFEQPGCSSAGSLTETAQQQSQLRVLLAGFGAMLSLSLISGAIVLMLWARGSGLIRVWVKVQALRA